MLTRTAGLLGERDGLGGGGSVKVNKREESCASLNLLLCVELVVFHTNPSDDQGGCGLG